ncbi:hypothetical protein [Caballeronia sp. SBC1]|uniref:hypothetical protein n=1 Tax=Caballeronia sp. SBC1 TaxID=2705548 RepID=UPI0014074C93|nr:hypothetical protein [Caballeronia sp. SBC1]
MNRTKMQTAEPAQQAIENLYEKVAQDVVGFMVDCQMNDGHVNVGNLQFAFDYAYRPLLRFWRDFELKTVIEAVTRQYPHWHAVAETRQRTAVDVLREVEELLACHAFDEANAEMMMALPLTARPRDEDAASEWICSELRKRKLKRELRFAQQGGWRCGERAFEILHCIEEAKFGLEFWRLPTHVARTYRNRCLAGH